MGKTKEKDACLEMRLVLLDGTLMKNKERSSCICLFAHVYVFFLTSTIMPCHYFILCHAIIKQVKPFNTFNITHCPCVRLFKIEIE